MQFVDSSSQSLPEHLSNLNPEQLEATRHYTGPILVLAGAGSGKTRVLTRRVASLILDHGVQPRNILAVTFTNKATEEMRERLQRILGEGSRQLWVATFHSTALRILRHNAHLLGYTRDFVVYDEDDSKAAIKAVMKELSIDEKKFAPTIFSRAIDRAKNNYESPEEAASNALGYEDKLAAEVYEHYQRALLRSNAMDFGDLLFNVVKLLKTQPRVLEFYRHQLHFILVDEFQDTNKVQYMLVRLLAEPRRNLLVVGDDDQSIYAFRGATIRNILEFEKDFPGAKVVKLEQNYRSSANILEVANSVIKRNQQRKAKKLWTEGARGDKIATYVASDETEEANFVVRQIQARASSGLPYSDIAIFYRTNAQSRAIEEALAIRGVPYRIFGGLKFYDRKEIKDILAYLRLLLNESDSQSFLRVINTPARGIGPTTVQGIVEEARSKNSTLLAAARTLAPRSKGIAQFIELFDELTARLADTALSDLIGLLLERSGYIEKLKATKDPTVESRLENIQELKGIAQVMEFEAESTAAALRTLLDRVALTAGNDLPANHALEGVKQETAQKNVVSLMTLHLAKGLEFPIVFLTGLEEGLLPHYRSIGDPVAIEEERRLCYVGITRAMQTLYITRATLRGLFAAGGSSGYREVSRFAYEMPTECLEHHNGDFIRALGFYGAEPDSDDEQGMQGSMRRENSYGFSVGARGRSSTPRQPKKTSGFAGLKTGDALLSESVSRTPVGPLATAEQLTPGVVVAHPTFGRGTVEAIEADAAHDPSKLKITVKFDALTEPKKFIFKFAKLELLQ
jgi:DNA helicase-2/ATP-dependent DNA helicase PcrA